MSNMGCAITESNVAKGKGAGYYLYRITVVFSVFFIAFSIFGIVNALVDVARQRDVGDHLLTAGVYVAVDLILAGYVIRAFRCTGLKKLQKSMKVKGFFEPAAAEEQFMAAQKVYLGVDFTHRTVGIASVYANGRNKRKRIVFDADVIESYEQNGSTLILNLRSVRVPTLRVTTLSGPTAYRTIEMLCKMGPKPELYRDEAYQKARARMKTHDWLIERDY